MVDSNPARKFTLDDFRKLLDQAGKPTPSEERMGIMPGMEALSEGMAEAEQREADRVRGIIDSMTPQERRDPVKLIGQSRSRRIAAGAGVEPREVEHLVRQFQAMAEIMDQLAQRRPPWRMDP